MLPLLWKKILNFVLFVALAYHNINTFYDPYCFSFVFCKRILEKLKLVFIFITKS